MDTRSLQYFVCASELLNFTKAAKECYISQTAISLSIAKMESELGYALFDRNNRIIRLTPAGEEFYTWARNMLQSYENTVKRGHNINLGLSGTIKLAFTGIFEAVNVMTQLQAFSLRCPGIDLEPAVIPAKRVMEQLKLGNVDAAVCVPYDFEQDGAFFVQDLYQFTFCLAISRLHPFAAMSHIPVEALLKESCIILDLAGLPASGQHMLREWERVGLKFPHIRQVKRPEEVLLMLQMSNNIAIIPDFYLTCFNVGDNVVYKALDLTEKPMMRMSFCAMKANKHANLRLLSGALQGFAYNVAEQKPEKRRK